MRTIIRNNYDPKTSDYHETLVIDDEREKKYLFDCDGVFTDITSPKVVSEPGDSEDYAASQKWVTEVQGDLADEIQNRTDADGAIWAEIEEIEMSSDVVDIVGTYAELQQYDTSKLHDNDIIKVLADETHQDETAYYRFSTSTSTFSYVGSEGPYYTESEIDTMMAGKQDTLIAGANIQIASDGKTISATDTTYTHFTGATASTDGVQGLVPGPLAGDEDKYLKGDGTWADASYDVFTSTDNGLVPAPGSSNYRLYLLDDGNWTPQIVAIVPSIDSDGQTLDLVYKMSNDFNYTVRQYNLRMTGATANADGKTGFVPRPRIADKDKFLKGDGTWGDVAATTTFYLSSFTLPPDNNVALYKDEACTSRASVVDVLDALKKGQVYLRSPDMTGDYLNYFSVTGYSADKIASSTYSVDIVIEGIFNEAVWMDSKPLVYELTFAGQTTSTDTFSLTDWTPLTSVPAASASTPGIAKLYTTTGQNTDGSMTQKAITDIIPVTNNISSADWSALWQ